MTLTDSPSRVVAVVLTHKGRYCLLRRSNLVSSERGSWHCVTGYLPPGSKPADHALVEVHEETGLTRQHLDSWMQGQTLRLRDAAGKQWTVFTFRCEVRNPRIQINWEHDAFMWVPVVDTAERNLVPWLSDVLTAVG